MKSIKELHLTVPIFFEGRCLSSSRTAYVHRGKRRSSGRRKIDNILLGCELPVSQVCHRQSDSHLRVWNHERQAARTQVCCCMFRALAEKAIRCIPVNGQGRVKGVFIARLAESLRFSMRTYWMAHKHVTLQTSARHVTYFDKLQKRSSITSTYSHSIDLYQHKPNTSVRLIINTPVVSLQERWDSNASSSSSKVSIPSKQRSTKKETRKLY